MSHENTMELNILFRILNDNAGDSYQILHLISKIRNCLISFQKLVKKIQNYLEYKK